MNHWFKSKPWIDHRLRSRISLETRAIKRTLVRFLPGLVTQCEGACWKERRIAWTTVDTTSARQLSGERGEKSGRKSVRIFIALTHYGVTDRGVARESQVSQPMNEPRCKDAIGSQRIERAPQTLFPSVAFPPFFSSSFSFQPSR